MSALLSPLTLKHITLRNRIVMPPMVTGKADAEGRVTAALLDHYAARARAGVALIIVEATAVDQRGRVWETGLGAFSPSHDDGLSRLAEAIHREGAVAGIQLVHGGPQSSPALCGGERLGPSAVAPPSGGPVPRALTPEEVKAIQSRFAEAAARAAAAGFDLIDLHGAHNFLLDTFLSAVYNTRTDAYGGPLPNRLRMLVETCRAAIANLPDRTLLACRISLFNKAPGEATLDSFRQVLASLEQAGLDLLDISTDGALKTALGSGETIGRLAKQFSRLPIIVAGGLGDPALAERAVAEGHTDLAAVGSAMMEDPAWAQRARQALAA